VTEDCFGEGWCDQIKPFTQKGKPVFAAEYTDTGVEIEQLCQKVGKLDFSLILKNRKPDSWRQVCP
jgi:Glycoside-hydrolase family GH114